ncbi:MAG: fimbrillin family protein [Bacteroidaceae bacterium]|nr:fimbrillin family protein [Bacteroidaceae bacterium]
MKLKLVSVAAALLILAACTNNISLYEPEEIGQRPNADIKFSNYVSSMTRASKNGATPFVAGDTMGVWGYQTTDDIVDTIFNNQPVYFKAENDWEYDNTKLWNIMSTYKFYGMFPYSKDLYVIGDDNKATIANYVNPDDADQQTDLMISEMRAISPFNTVDMIFHHILSNLNIKVKISNKFDASGVSSATLQRLHLSGIKNTGTYTQTGWTSANVPVGEWSGQSGLMNIADITNIAVNTDGTASDILSDYMVMPQKLFTTQATAQDVMIDAVFRIRYTDGTSSTFTKKGIRLAGINGTTKDSTVKISSWDINCRYNYTLVFNPTQSTRVWDADGDGSIIIDPDTGDTITTTDDTPTPGTMKYDPENPDVIQVLEEDQDGDGKPDWVEYPIVWEDVDGDDLLEAGIDRDGDGHIDNIDEDNDTNQGGDPHNDPSDGNPNNPDGKDVILVKVDTDDDGTPDTWVQLEKDPVTGEIYPERDTEEAAIEFTATVCDWDDVIMADYDVK